MGSCISCLKKKKTFNENSYLLYDDRTSVSSSDTTIDKNIISKNRLTNP